MRATTTVPLLLAAASIAPVFASPIVPYVTRRPSCAHADFVSYSTSDIASREDIQLLARAIGDELYARGMDDELMAREPLGLRPILRLPVNRFPVNRFRFGRIGTVVHPQRSLDDDALFERSFDGELYVREPLDWEKLYNINKTPVNLLKPIPHVQRSLDDDALFERSFDGELYAREPFDLAALRNVNKTPVNLLKPLPANTRVGRGLEDDALFARALSEELLARSGTVLDELD